MRFHRLSRFSPFRTFVLLLLCGFLLVFAVPSVHAQAGSQGAPAPKAPGALGTIKAISGNVLTLTTDNGAELRIPIEPDVKVISVPPGSKDLKAATPIQLSDLQPGDRVLVRGKLGEDASSFAAASIVAMKKMDIAAKQAKEREEWQRHGIGGLVSSVDAANNLVTIKTLTAAGSKDIAIHISSNTVLRRYAPGSVKFDDAKVAPITDILPGDQLRARGTRSADGGEFTADEIVSGTFHNIAGVVSAVNTGAGTLTVSDIATNKSVELKVTPDSQLRKLPQEMAQRIAFRFKTAAAGASGGNGAAPAGGQPSGTPPARGAQGAPGSASASGGPGGPARNGGGEMQQMLSHLPVSPLSDFQKGDVVMIVATSGPTDGESTVITLLGGVEPILQVTTQGQAASILSPWSLGQGGGEEGPP